MRVSRTGPDTLLFRSFFAKFVDGYTRAKERNEGGGATSADGKNVGAAVSEWASEQITGFLQRGKGEGIAEDDVVKDEDRVDETMGDDDDPI